MTPGVAVVVGLAAILVGGFSYIAKTVAENRTRRHLVDRGLTAEEIRTLFRATEPAAHGTLRAALVLLAVGTALIVAQYLPYGAGDPFAYGLVVTAGGVGLLLYLWLAPRFFRRDRER